MALSARMRILLAFGFVGALVAVGGAYYATTSSTQDAGKLQVAASFYPYYYLSSRVGGDQVAVVNLVPPGVEPHDWEPTPSVIAGVYASDVFVYNGYLEAFLGALFAELPPDTPVRVNTTASIQVNETGNGEVDPHVWLDPGRAAQIVDAIESAFSAVRPEASSSFHANAEQVRSELAAIDAAYASGLASCARRTIVTQHEAFGYPSARYNLTMVPIQGLSPDAEPTPEQLAQIRDVINQTGVHYLFYEELVDPRVAQTLAQEAGVGTLILDPIEGLSEEGARQGKTYLTIFGQNLANLRIALECT